MTDERRAVRRAYDALDREYVDQREDSFAERQVLEEFVYETSVGVADRNTATGGDGRPHVLDAGCGAGDPVAAFLADRVRVTGLDFSRSQLRLASDRTPGAALVQGDLTALPFSDGVFDGLCAVYSVIHVPSEHHERCFAEFHRVCRPDAPVVVTVGATDWTGSQDDWLGSGVEMHWDIPGVERATSLLEDAGFDVSGHELVTDPVAEEDGEQAFVRARA